MTILVTGSDGYIGTAFRTHVTDWSYRRCELLPPSLSLRDWADMARMGRISIDCVVHLGDPSSPAQCGSGFLDWRQTRKAIRNRIESLAMIGKPTVYVSSSAAGEDTNYGRMKAMGEKLVREWLPSHVILRPVNVVGGQDPNTHRLVPAMWKSFLHDRPFHLYGNASREYVDVRDMATALQCAVQWLVDHPGERLWHPAWIGSVNSHTTLGVLHLAELHWNCKLDVRFHRPRDRQKAYQRSAVSVSAASRIGWTPRWTLVDAIASVPPA